MKSENPPTSIEQWYRRATALDRNWRESRREEVSGAVHTGVEVRRMDLEMNGLFGEFILSIMVHLADKPSGH